jgi:hypothetical protein
MIPTQGRIVQYTLSEQDAAAINKRRKDAHESQIAASNSGAVVHHGNGVQSGDTYPMVIVRCWGTTEESSVNGQVLLDGNDTYWATSVSQGDGERQWREFPRV